MDLINVWPASLTCDPSGLSEGAGTVVATFFGSLGFQFGPSLNATRDNLPELETVGRKELIP